MACKREVDRLRYVRAHGAESRRNPPFQRGLKKWVRSLKIGRPCTDCGQTYPPEAMQWDHLPGRPKIDAISEMRAISRQQILAELAKCELVCANCHTIRTFTRRGWDLREACGSYAA